MRAVLLFCSRTVEIVHASDDGVKPAAILRVQSLGVFVVIFGLWLSSRVLGLAVPNVHRR